MRDGAVSLYLDRSESLSLAFLVALLGLLLVGFHHYRLLRRDLRELGKRLDRLWA